MILGILQQNTEYNSESKCGIRQLKQTHFPEGKMLSAQTSRSITGKQKQVFFILRNILADLNSNLWPILFFTLNRKLWFAIGVKIYKCPI